MLTNIFINFGFLLCFLVGLLIPTDPAKFATDEMWKVVSAMPAVFGLVTIVLWSLVYTEEPVTFSISNSRDEAAKRLLSRVYSISTKSNTSQKSESSSDKENLSDPEMKSQTEDQISSDDLFEEKLKLCRSSTLLSNVKKGYCSEVFGA